MEMYSNEEIKNMNIYEKMLAVQQEMPVVEKKDLIENSGKPFTVSRATDVIRAVKPLEAKYRICSFPTKESSITGFVMNKKYMDDKTMQEKELALMNDRVEIVYRFLNIDNPVEYVDVISFGTGINARDKAPSIAMTNAIKSALIHAYKIEQVDINDPNLTPTTDGVSAYDGNSTVGSYTSFTDVAEETFKTSINEQQTMMPVEIPIDDGLPHTVEAARAVHATFGELSGTIGDLWDNPENKKLIQRYYATAKALERCEKKAPEVAAALKIMLEHDGIKI